MCIKRWNILWGAARAKLLKTDSLQFHPYYFQRIARDPTAVPDGPDASFPGDGQVAVDKGAQRVRDGEEHVRKD